LPGGTAGTPVAHPSGSPEWLKNSSDVPLLYTLLYTLLWQLVSSFQGHVLCVYREGKEALWGLMLEAVDVCTVQCCVAHRPCTYAHFGLAVLTASRPCAFCWTQSQARTHCACEVPRIFLCVTRVIEMVFVTRWLSVRSAVPCNTESESNNCWGLKEAWCPPALPSLIQAKIATDDSHLGLEMLCRWRAAASTLLRCLSTR
jgi:hypothetical protein